MVDIEVNNGNTEKFIPHPILDDPVKMMRIIANPVYDKLTISRAAHIRKYPSATYVRKSVKLQEKPIVTPVKSLNTDETIITPLPTNNNNNQTQLKTTSKRQNPPPISLLTRSITNRISPRGSKLSMNSRASSVHSSVTEIDKKPIIDGTVRYVNSRHGFEVQRYSSSNWLSIDLLTKDACESEEKTFREMLEKKDKNELLNRSIYTSDYYRQRFEDLLQSYKDGHLRHDEWAKQNYQLHCLKIFYTQAFEREQQRLSLYEHNQRQRRAQCIFNEWKEAKDEEHNDRRRSRLDTANSHRTIDVTSALSDLSSPIPNHKTNRLSISSITDNNLPALSLFQPIKRSKKISQLSTILDEQRWSLNAMLKRVVGLAKPLPPPPKIINRQHSSLTNVSNDSGFESGP